MELNEIILEINSGFIQKRKKKECQLSIQIIPNVQRIKIEKLTVAKDIVAA